MKGVHAVAGTIGFIILNCMSVLPAWAQVHKQADVPLRVVVAGISHGHASWIYGLKATADIEVLGIYERNTELAEVYRKRFGLDKTLFYTDMEAMLDQLKPQAALAFNPTSEHLDVVKACAPRGIHVMVEKPLATTVKDALEMQTLAKKYKIHLLTNYETSWYPTTTKSFELVTDSNFIGAMKKVIFHTGHSGARNTEQHKYFFSWLTDPVKNGGGAITDFGCYGANMMTYLSKGEIPASVSAITRQFKPDIYPNVDDEATIIVSYATAQCIIQASWNWPFNRKDMWIYGDRGYIIASNDTSLEVRNNDTKKSLVLQIAREDVNVYGNPFSYFADVIRGKLEVPVYGTYSLENNVTVVRILEAARQSAASGRVVYLKK